MSGNLQYWKNKAVNDLNGELWKDVVDYEEQYEVSNFGRVRSKERFVPHHVNGVCLKKARIMTQNVKTTDNVRKGRYNDLQVALTKDSKTTFKSVKRLVYSSFVNSNIDFKKDKLVIKTINYDDFDLRVENLSLITLTERSTLIKNRGRFYNYFITADRSKWSRHPGWSRRRSILAINLRTKDTIWFISMAEAARVLKVDASEIVKICKGRRTYPLNGYVFQYCCFQKENFFNWNRFTGSIIQ